MATFYIQITPINTLSTSTYSLYFDSIAPSNLIASGVSQDALRVGNYAVESAGHSSVIVKNEDPDCCCDAQSFIFPTPAPTTTAPTTAAPTTAAPTTAAPTTAAPTTVAPTTAAPTTAAPTTAAPTTAAPTTAAPTSPISVSGVGGYMQPCVGGSIDDYMGASVSVSSPVNVDTIFSVDVKYVLPGNSCAGPKSTQGFSLTILAGESSSTFDACDNGAYFSGGAVICSACVASCDNPAVSLTGFTC
jgi:hypothetical protein